jgi:hypothetical protein
MSEKPPLHLLELRQLVIWASRAEREGYKRGSEESFEGFT